MRRCRVSITFAQVGESGRGCRRTWMAPIRPAVAACRDRQPTASAALRAAILAMTVVLRVLAVFLGSWLWTPDLDRAALIQRMEQRVLRDPVPYLKRITAPTSLLRGQQDQMMPVVSCAGLSGCDQRFPPGRGARCGPPAARRGASDCAAGAARGSGVLTRRFRAFVC